MKNILIITILSALALLSCRKDKETVEPAPNIETSENEIDLTLAIPPYQNATIFFYTSTGCPGCGSWGGPAFESLANSQKNIASAIAIHIKYGDPFITQTSQAIADNRIGQLYTPQIHIGDKNIVLLNGNSIDDNASLQQANDSITSNSSNNPIASCASTYQIDDSFLVVKYGVNFYEPVTGEYYVAAYILEDGLINYQSGAPSSIAEHNNVIRATVGGNYFGSLIKNGTINSNEAYENQISTLIDSDWNTNNLKVATVIWEKIGNNYKVINSSVFKL